ncbi:hypothetical protein [Accumulibacter sp.]|uniref:hypothetical protein n=1 Tax=Accumulibacter sp. TaxID=2053492 RepID=UPI0025E57618|nr:hypothetical protein [Accumulibacter sp.]MCP5228066.1 hypothetical protein [Accumulibacter sp.]
MEKAELVSPPAIGSICHEIPGKRLLIDEKEQVIQHHPAAHPVAQRIIGLQPIPRFPRSLRQPPAAQAGMIDDQLGNEYGLVEEIAPVTVDRRRLHAPHGRPTGVARYVENAGDLFADASQHIPVANSCRLAAATRCPCSRRATIAEELFALADARRPALLVTPRAVAGAQAIKY